MRLRVLTPSEVVVDEEVEKVSAEAPNGSFTLLPRHIDFATALVPGLLTFRSKDSGEHYLAIDEGILVKRQAEVRVSTRDAVRGPSLEGLREAVRERFHQLDEDERQARTALAKLELGFARRYLELVRGH
ncbi:MAG: F0F1 ATP synthase subunit epsilon [Anaerolineae bacterium]|nr:F0F1 ATP synthase subunit epsilon [Anaerolineae bacterium]